MSLKGAIVTGGTRGIGFGISQKLAEVKISRKDFCPCL